MTKTAKSPDNCETMIDVRNGVDATDRELIRLLETRFGYMRAAARIKQDRNAVRDEDRKASVINSAADLAEKAGLPSAAIASIWDKLVEASIAYELAEWDQIRT